MTQEEWDAAFLFKNVNWTSGAYVSPSFVSTPKEPEPPRVVPDWLAHALAHPERYETYRLDLIRSEANLSRFFAEEDQLRTIVDERIRIETAKLRKRRGPGNLPGE